MTQPTRLSLDDYRARQGMELGRSAWIDIDQMRIDAFADATLDHQFIHTDPERAGKTPFGGTIAHGFLSLSLLSRMLFDVLPEIDGIAACINYGMNHTRFLAPVPSGSRVRGHFVLTSIEPKGSGGWLATHGVTIEIEGKSKPALVAEWLILLQS